MSADTETIREALSLALDGEDPENDMSPGQLYVDALAALARLETERAAMLGAIGEPCAECGHADWRADPNEYLERMAALEAKRDEARRWANTMEHERDWERDVVQSEMRARIEALEAAAHEVIAAAKRGHEHEVDEALSLLADATTDRPFGGELDDTRAAG